MNRFSPITGLRLLSRRSAARRPVAPRGVVLMVMLSLLALFTVLAVTFVVASGQFRRGAAIASKAEQMGDPFDALLQQALMQVARGSQQSQSAIGFHSLLEDMYGQADGATGCIYPTTGNSDLADEIGKDWEQNSQEHPQSMLIKFVAYNFGWDRQPGVAYGDDDENSVVDDITEVFMEAGDDCFFGNTLAFPLKTGTWPTQEEWSPAPNPPQIVDNVDNYYSGRVLTFISGPAAGQSCYIVRSKIVPDDAKDLSRGVRTVFSITPPANGKNPSVQYNDGKVSPDRFVINGRPFNGRGIGATPYVFNAEGMPTGIKPAIVDGRPNPKLRMLDQPYRSSIDAVEGLNGKQVPLAYTPNPVDPGMRDYINRYAPHIEADEDYDAPDLQNMLLSYRQWNTKTSRFETIAPSLHRPDLVNYLVHNATVNPKYASLPNPRWYHLPPGVRRRAILRPDPVDHYDYTQEGVLNPSQSDGWTPGEPFVDVNQNGQWDSYVASLGGAEKYTDLNDNRDYDVGDRPYFNPNFDAVNGPWDVDNDGDGIPDSIWVDLGMPVITSSDGRLVKPLFALMVVDLDGRVNVNAHGSPGHYGVSQPELAGVAQPNGDFLSGLTSQLPVNLPVHKPGGGDFYTSEERVFIGAHAYALTQSMGVSPTTVVRDPVIGSGLFAAAPQSTARWASAYLNDNPSFDPALNYQQGVLTRTGIQTPFIQPAFGQGYSPADVNLAPILWNELHDLPHLTPLASKSLVTSTNKNPPRTNYYRRILEGYYKDPMPVPGRYGEMDYLISPAVRLSGLGPVPRAGSTRNDAQFNLFQDDDMPAVPSGTGGLLGSNMRDGFGNRSYGDYATPGDFASRGAIGLDLLGQPILAGMQVSDTVDEPTEINLNRRYYPTMVVSHGSTQGVPSSDPSVPARQEGRMTYRDAPFTPSELERLLRVRDPNSTGLSDRLISMFDDEWYLSNALTTESWDVPCPHVAPTPELAAALSELGLPVGNPTMGDLLRARFYLASGRNPTMTAARAASLATIAMRSYAYKDSSGNPSDVERQDNRSRLISPDIALGLRMDINAPFGDGVDNDNDNIVDEPGEGPEYLRVYADPYNPSTALSTLNFDGNRDGNSQSPAVNPPDYTREFENPRQQFAKELYCLMILLIDENYVMPAQQRLTAGSDPGAKPMVTEAEPVDLDAAGSPVNFKKELFPQLSDDARYVTTNFPGDETESQRKAKRWLTAQRIAQWAINAVDFRDRDSIMSPFEFDVDPFNDNDSTSPGTAFSIRDTIGTYSTWDVDGDLTTDENQTNNASSSGNWVRGVVWGCEYPDLLLTETLAFHDRRTANTMHEVEDPMGTVRGKDKLCKTEVNASNPRGQVVYDPDNPTDKTWDQVRVPEGSAFVELYATGNPNVRQFQALELYTPDGRLDLGRKAGNSPVWRLAITQGRLKTNVEENSPRELPHNDIAMRLTKTNPGTCSLDPQDPGFSILPWVNETAGATQAVVIERVVTFCGPNAGVTDPATSGLNSTTPTEEIDVFSARSNVSLVMPGEYVVVGPHREGGLGDVTTLGRTSKALALRTDDAGDFLVVAADPLEPTDSPQPQGVLSLQQGTFLATSANGVDEYPVHSLSLTMPTWTLPTSYLGELVNARQDYSNTPTVPTYNQIQRPVAIACAANPPADGGSLTPPLIGFNISEPTNEERKTVYFNHGGGTLTLGTWSDEWNPSLTRNDEITSGDSTQRYDDIPWDGYYSVNEMGGEEKTISNPQLPCIEDSTSLRLKSIFLQRLADPTRQWDKVTNPYLTIDWMPFDLTVFNGEPWWVSPDASDREEQLEEMTKEHIREAGNVGEHPMMGVVLNGNQEDEGIRFGSRQRGAPRRPFKENFSHFNLWSQPNWLDRTVQGSTLPPLTKPIEESDPASPSKYYLGDHKDGDGGTDINQQYYCKWQHPLQHTLGYINEPYHYYRRFRTTYVADQEFNPTRHYMMRPMSRPATRGSAATDPDPTTTADPTAVTKSWLMGCDFNSYDSMYIGGPWRPFNWLTWNNRPFSGAMELMLVPAVGPGRLLHEYDMRRTVFPTSPTEDDGYPIDMPAVTDFAPWESKVSANHYLPPMSVESEPGFFIRPPFGHLLNFFESSPGAAFGPTPIAWSISGSNRQSYSAGNFYRLLEFVTVPSRFSGTRQVHRNNLFNNTYGNSNGKFSGFEHPAWPFIAPFNTISAYREPGRVNLNTMPVMPNRGTFPKSQTTGFPERNSDQGSAIWRSVTNEFHPKIRWVTGGGATSLAVGRYNRVSWPSTNVKTVMNSQFNTSEGLQGSDADYAWNPSQDSADNFHNLFAGLHSDNPRYDPRGIDGAPGTADDVHVLPLDQRCDPERPSLFNNPFRSFSEGFGAVPPAIPTASGSPVTPIESYYSSLGSEYPFLSVDSTLLRRRDTLWSPWDTSNQLIWPAMNYLNNVRLFSPVQSDSAFDPLFALNFPRLFSSGLRDFRNFSGYSINMFFTGMLPGVDRLNGPNTYHYLSRTTDYRNTDRNPFFRYQLYSKLSNIATTRSNVYAIWVTMGYFEVERVGVNETLPSQERSEYFSGQDLPMPYRYPDGYRIVRELGSESGDIERHKAFAIFDRTIPVGFMRGENLNVDQAFLIRRILY